MINFLLFGIVSMIFGMLSTLIFFIFFNKETGDYPRDIFLRILIEGYARTQIFRLAQKSTQSHLPTIVRIEQYLRLQTSWLADKYEELDTYRKAAERNPDDWSTQHRIPACRDKVKERQTISDRAIGLAFLGGYGKIAAKILKKV